MIIPYKDFPYGERLPFVSIIFIGKNKTALVEAFVDTGADFSIFHADLMKYLGLEKKNAQMKKVQVGDGDYITVYLFHIKVSFYGQDILAPITFSENLGPDFNLLGRKGFFDHFRFCFDDKNSHLSLTPLK